MRLAIFADIHANRQAFSACLEAARSRGAERMICLGDYVGYGADPEWTVETVMALVDDGAMAVRGNHDNAIGTPSESMNAAAQAAIEWTRGRLRAPQRRFLAELPLTSTNSDDLKLMTLGEEEVGSTLSDALNRTGSAPYSQGGPEGVPIELTHAELALRGGTELAEIGALEEVVQGCPCGIMA